ncbi:hypothetical protein GWI33_008014 [Rhynchophorus ferrugineus]|uniref:Uncharacterized protein n=1 Tax=Rhynchophorus ferrugineus TaxID=354439 RepID=A0A834IJ16_RHYFE|nr:hypothetical protein GWI33_008014 [Rhynchophorus ferrugineus]
MQETTEEYESTSKRCSIAMFCGKTSLFVLMVGYALFGALLFKFLEGGNEDHHEADFQKTREDCLRELWIITGNVEIIQN